MATVLDKDLTDRTDRELLGSHCAGDADAFAEIFRRHKDGMWALALRTCGDRELASDGLLDAFVDAFRRPDSFRVESALTTWLHHIVVTACLDHLRQRTSATPLPQGPPADRHGEHPGAGAALDLRSALTGLPEGQRMALVLVDLEGMSIAEAAAILEVAEGTITSQYALGHASLAELSGPTGTGRDGTGTAHASVRDLVADQQSPGSMPEDVFARISTALDTEQTARAEDDGLSDAEDDGLSDDLGLATAALPREGASRHGPRRWSRVLLAAAGVVVVGAVATMALRASGTGTVEPAAVPSSLGAGQAGGGAVHIQVSSAVYTQSGLTTQARTLLNAPAASVLPTDAEAVGIGPIATRAGLDACLASLGESLGEGGAGAVTVDIATYDGRPAAIIVVTKGATTTAYAVQRDCSTGDPRIIQDSVPVP